MIPRQKEIEKCWKELNVVDDDTVRRSNAMGASSVAKGFKLKVDMVMVCRFCGKELYHLKAGECSTHDIHGTCDCSWHCCERVNHRHHERHLVWIPERTE